MSNLSTQLDSPAACAPRAAEQQPGTSRTAKWALALSALSVLLSGLVAVQTLNEDDFRDDVTQRLICLESPGVNDCGADGK